MLSIAGFLKENEKKDLLRFSTAGSIDDGKSTLIGRLLHDSKNIYEDTLASLRKLSRDTSSAEKIDLALLTDGLRAEREQGITIDVAYRYFSTPRRKSSWIAPSEAAVRRVRSSKPRSFMCIFAFNSLKASSFFCRSCSFFGSWPRVGGWGVCSSNCRSRMRSRRLMAFSCSRDVEAISTRRTLLYLRY